VGPEGCIGQWRGGRQVLTREFQAFRGTLGMGVRLCGPNDPEAKGMVERTHRYYETSFLPGRRFDDVDDFNRQFTKWLRRANNRIHGTTRQRPSEAIYEGRAAMMSFPPVLPDPSWRFTARLPRDHHVRVDTNDYSVNPRFVGRRIEVRVTLDEVIATCDNTEVARHKRCLAKHQTLLHPGHARVLRAMRAGQLGAAAFADTLEERDLADYDRAEVVSLKATATGSRTETWRGCHTTTQRDQRPGQGVNFRPVEGGSRFGRCRQAEHARERDSQQGLGRAKEQSVGALDSVPERGPAELRGASLV
jgi:hypothetical protein